MTGDSDRADRQRNLPIYWFNKASDIRAAAGAVWVAIQEDKPDPQLGLPDGFSMSAACPLVYRMLCGQALELCLKAVIVAKHEKPKHTHQLEKLSQQAGVSYDERCMGLLRVLSDAIIWMGRYPIPSGTDDQMQEKYISASAAIDSALFDRKTLGNIAILSPNLALDWIGFGHLWDLASQEYWQHHRDG